MNSIVQSTIKMAALWENFKKIGHPRGTSIIPVYNQYFRGRRWVESVCS